MTHEEGVTLQGVDVQEEPVRGHLGLDQIESHPWRNLGGSVKKRVAAVMVVANPRIDAYESSQNPS